jgi:hypothetical protein
MDDTQDGRWLTYAELAAIRGINRASAVKLVQRERWQRSSGNDRARTVRVLVPPDWLQLAKERPPDTGDVPTMSGEYTRMLAAANVRADEANKRADAALAVADRTLAQLAASNAAITEERERVTDLQRELATAQADLAEQRGLSEQARAEAQEAQEAIRRLEQEGPRMRGRRGGVYAVPGRRGAGASTSAQ